MSIVYQAKYSNSWAIVIGINNYQYANPLAFACNDARAVKDLLVEEFDFPADNVILLLNENATKTNILREFMKHANGNTEHDDRLLVFYAGHGHTISGKRGEIGFLIPVDGNINDISTIIRWDEITRNSELFQAKHALFIMDACYGGLAITRSLPPGSTRFLKDMLRRYTRQVLTAGKADETVADAGGPIAGHSIFTGHLIEALKGKAAQHDGTITANGVMSYVYEKVSKDQYSNQSPHFGYFEGDGDFVFKTPLLNAVNDTEAETERTETDQMIVVQPVYSERQHAGVKVIDEVKEYLAEERYFIKLDDLVNRELRYAIGLFSNEFAMQDTFSDEELINRLKKYENITVNIIDMVAAVSYWGTSRYLPCLRKTISRLTDFNSVSGDIGFWLKLRWYPLLLLTYAGGIGAIASQNYDMLAALLLTKVANERRGKEQAIVLVTIYELSGLDNQFRAIPGHQQKYVPRSEYLFKLLQPQIDDLFFLGKSYEAVFDKFEVLLALVHADVYESEGHGVWGPHGRFAWKYKSFDNDPLKLLLAEAEALKDEWPLLKAGLFRGSYGRFKYIADQYLTKLSELNWH